MAETKSTETATGTAKIEYPLPIAIAALLLLVLALEGFALLLDADDVPEKAGLSVELITGEVGDRVTVAVPCSTSKYIPYKKEQ